MVTISSTPEKNLQTLTGNECIPLSDKTHIKTKVLLSLYEKINDIVTNEGHSETAMYRIYYDFTGDNNIDNVLNNQDISFDDYLLEDDKLYINGEIIINTPHKGKYYITVNIDEPIYQGNIIQIGDNVYNINKKIISINTNVQDISIILQDYTVIKDILIVETPMDISEIAFEIANEEIDKKTSFVDNGCLNLLL